MVRLALGLKGLNWKSVIVPNISPKPDLTALTGGYERVPVLQIGADIYCDTACIMGALERHKPSPSLYPGPLGRAGHMLALWAGGPAFTPAVGAALGPMQSNLPEEFWADRERRFGMKRAAFGAMVPHLKAQFGAAVAMVEETLSDGRAFISGDGPGHADLALYMLIWFQGHRGGKPSDYGQKVADWCARVADIGHGTSEDWSGGDAIRHAAEMEPHHDYGVLPDTGFSAGDEVIVRTETPDPGGATGTLIGLDDEAITLARTDERAGKVHVHLPRFGQVVAPA